MTNVTINDKKYPADLIRLSGKEINLMLPNSEKYNFSDFTLDKYEEFLRNTKEYKFSHEFLNSDEANIVLYHDVDSSLDSALEIAELEYKYNVSSTYFILLRTEFYNILEERSIKKLRKLIEMNHRIGLHFDCSLYKINNEIELEKYLLIEKEALSNFTSIVPEDFTFHNSTLNLVELKKHEYAGLRNCSLWNDNYVYCSDSNGYWRHKRLFDLLDAGKYPKLHLLLHPCWWSNGIRSPKERIKNLIEYRADNIFQCYCNLIEKNGRKCIDW